MSAVSHGIGHHSDSEAIDFGKSDLQSLSQFLGKKDYFFGKTPHQLDVVAFAHISQFVFVPFEGMKEWMETETPNLIAFVNRMKEKYYPDWDEMCKTLEINTHLPKKELTPEEVEAQKKAEEKKAEEERKKEEKKKEKVSKKKAKSKTLSAPDPASKDPSNDPANVPESNEEAAEGSSSTRPTRSSQSFRLPSLVSITRTLSNVTRKTGTYRFSSQSLTPEQQEERKKQKEEEKKKAKEEKERKKKEAEEAKAKAAQEKKEKEEKEKEEKEEKERIEKEKKEAEAKEAAEKKEEPKEEAKEEKKE